jgi:hypothetical protein
MQCLLMISESNFCGPAGTDMTDLLVLMPENILKLSQHKVAQSKSFVLILHWAIRSLFILYCSLFFLLHNYYAA